MVKTLILIDFIASYNHANFRIHLKTQHFNRVSVIFQNLYSKQEKMGRFQPRGFYNTKLLTQFICHAYCSIPFWAGG